MTKQFFIPEFLPKLKHGPGESPDRGGCIMEVCAFLWDGESWHDQPECVLPLLRSVAIGVNDSVRDEERQQLYLLIPRLLNTNPAPIVHKFDPFAAPGMEWRTIHPTQEQWDEQQRITRLLEPFVEDLRREYETNNVTLGVDYLTEILDEYDRIAPRSKDEWVDLPKVNWEKLEGVFSGKEVLVKDGQATLVSH